MDTVFIRDLEIDTIVGVYDWERIVRQRVLLSLEMRWDNATVAATDDLELALNYKAVSDRVTSLVQAGEFRLLETAAETIANVVMREFSVAWVRVDIGKPDAIPAANSVGVIIERGS